MTKSGTRRALTPDVGVGYKASYKDKQSGANVSYLKIYIRPDELAKLTVGQNGMVALTGFINTNKKSEKAPDMVLKPATTKSTRKDAPSASNSQASSSESFPF